MSKVHCPKCGCDAEMVETQNGKMSTTYVCECDDCGHTWEIVG